MTWIFLDVAGENALNTSGNWVPLVRAHLADLKTFEGYPEAFKFALDALSTRDTSAPLGQFGNHPIVMIRLVPFRKEWLSKIAPKKRKKKRK